MSESAGSSRTLMIVVPSLSGGGAERAAANLVRQFCATDIDVTLVLFHNQTCHGLPDRVRVRFLDVSGRGNVFSLACKFLSLTAGMRTLMSEEKPCTVLSFMDYTNIVVLLGSMFLRHKPRMAISVRTSPALHFRMNPGLANRVLALLMRLLYARADAVIGVSEFVRQDLIENYKIDAERAVTIPNPVDLLTITGLAQEEASLPWHDRAVPVVLSVGRLSKEKGFDVLLKAIAMVKASMDVRLLVLGEGAEEDTLKRMRDKLGLDEDVVFAGFQENPYKFMSKATLFVLPSRYEGFPNALVEAMACGLPVISTIYGSSSHDIVEHEKTGLLVPIEDEKALAESILRLLNNEEERARYAGSAKERVRDFVIENIAEKYVATLFDLKSA